MTYVIRVDYDQFCEDPQNYDHTWRIYPFRNRGRVDFEERWRDFSNVGLQAKIRVGLAFPLSAYEHGGIKYYLYGQGPGYDRQWDYTYHAGIMVWEHSPKDIGAKTYEDRVKDAQSCLDEYNDWLNGNCYSYDITRIDKCPTCQQETEEEEIDSCSGIIGWDYLAQCLNQTIKDNHIEHAVLRGKAKGFIENDLDFYKEEVA